MNNFILSFCFLVLLFVYYYFVGCFALVNLKIDRDKVTLRIIIGWIITFTIGWFIGFPLQILGLGWNQFALIYKLVLIILFVISIVGICKLKREQIISLCSNIKKHPYYILQCVFQELKRHWFIYLFVLIFTFFSITNLQPYTVNNYLDDSYISKMVHMRSNSILFGESQSSGEVLKSYGKFSLAVQQSQRMFNTYELVYTVLADIASIDIVFFARFTITIHNYLIWFFSFQLFGTIFIDEKKSQYTIAPFALLLIPEGFAAKGMGFFSIRVFENWRNQTAMYMGGSIVRDVAFPLLIYFSYLFYRRKTIRGFMIFPSFALLLLSYQTTGISYIILFFPFFVFGLILNNVYKFYIKRKERNLCNIWNVIIIVAIVIIIMLLLITKIDALTMHINISSKYNLISGIPFNYKTLVGIYNQYLPYYNNVFKLDFFANTGLFIIVITMLLIRNYYSKIISMIILFLFLLFKLNRAKLTLSLISFEFYCTARMLHGVELLIIALYGIFFIGLLSRLISNEKKQNSVISIVSCCIIMSTVLFIEIDMPKILKYHNIGDGVIQQGYSFKPIIENDKMMPQIFLEIGKYFNNLPSNKYSIFSFQEFKYEGLTYTKQYLLLSSAKLEFYPDWKVYETAKKNGDLSTVKKIDYYNSADFALTNYLQGNYYVGQYNKIAPYVNKSGLKYAFFTDKTYVDNLTNNGWHVVLGGDEKKYWLLKR